ncbi:MAG: Holliday junction resolvase RuvX, partial [Aerococcus urinaeequi]
EIIPIDEELEEFGLDRLGELIAEYKVEALVLGLPKNMNNSIGPRAEASQKYGQLVIDLFDLPVFYQDERLTTVQAERMLIANDVSRKKRKKVIDKLAAVLILQNYLDAHPS